MSTIEESAALANSKSSWDVLWNIEERRDYSLVSLGNVYLRILYLLPKELDIKVVDLGGGPGLLANMVQQENKLEVIVVDHSTVALELAKNKGLKVQECDLAINLPVIEKGSIVTATEFLEHLPNNQQDLLMEYLFLQASALLVSIPDYRLGPDEEEQHTIKWTAVQFKKYLERFWANVRVECIDGYLLGVCTKDPKPFTLTVCTPARDEAEDLQKTLASFRAIADEIVVGIDPRTTDNSREIAERYAEVVFDLVDPEGPEDEKVPNGGVHFSWIRNQCIDKSSSDWIFMTEAHERLSKGTDVLLGLHQLPEGTKVGFVWRTSDGQRWGFPWLFKNRSDIRFKRSTHNQLEFPSGALTVKLPQIETIHERAKNNALKRIQQRKIQNRKTLMDDWRCNENLDSLYYLANEWRPYNSEKTKERLEQLLSLPAKNGPLRYQSRLISAKMYYKEDNFIAARSMLLGCTNEDWSRIEHWLWLGDLAYSQKNYEEALQFYLYSSTRINNPPFTLWWIDDISYSYLPAQRLTVTYAILGNLQQALYWAEKTVDLLGDNIPEAIYNECVANVKAIREAIDKND